MYREKLEEQDEKITGMIRIKSGVEIICTLFSFSTKRKVKDKPKNWENNDKETTFFLSLSQDYIYFSLDKI